MTKKFGLDFGTTNSSIAIEEEGVGKVLAVDKLALDPRVVRSMLYFFPRKFVVSSKVPLRRVQLNVFYPDEVGYEGEFKSLIGEEAISQYIKDNRNRKQEIIRTILTGNYIGGGGADEVAERYEEVDYGVGRLMQALKTALKSPQYKGSSVFGKYFSLEELIGTFIGEIKKIAEEIVGERIESVKAGRPVHFLDDPERDKQTQKRLEEALRLAGFKEIEFEFEPVAAASQFIASSEKITQTVLVFDFGGGTLDTAIVRDSEVLATDGIYIGGDLLNADIMRAKLWKFFGYGSLYGDQRLPVNTSIYESLDSWYSIPNLNTQETLELLERSKYKNIDEEAISRLIYLIRMNLGFDLYEAIEKAKKELSFNEGAVISFESGPIRIEEGITRLEFEEIILPRVEAIKEVVLKTLESAKITPSEIDVVIRTGGSSLIPVFEEMLRDIFGKEKIKKFETFTSIAAGLSLK